jgi:DNA-directed RNA polymerase subunit RPC12/RpoP
MNKLLFMLILLLQTNIAFAAIQDGRWHVGIGDPTIFGWVTVLAYLLAAWRCVVKADESKDFGGNYPFWLYLAAFLLFLAINKQLDLQSWLTDFARESAKAHGWYEHRKPVQITFIGLLAFGMVTVLFSLRLFFANAWRHNKITWLGIVLLCTFIVMRAASFHHFDILINYDILGIKINVVLELGAIALIILGTYFNKKYAVPMIINKDNLKEIVAIDHDGDDVRCPRCGAQPLAKPVDGRLFKCRACAYKYRIEVID